MECILARNCEATEQLLYFFFLSMLILTSALSNSKLRIKFPRKLLRFTRSQQLEQKS